MKRSDLLLLALLVAAIAGGVAVWLLAGRPGADAVDLADRAAAEGDAADGSGADGSADELPGGGRVPRAPNGPILIEGVPTFSRADGVFGRVTDERDAPIAGALVTLQRSEGSPWGSAEDRDVAAARTAADGTYLVGPIGAADAHWSVRAEASGYARDALSVDARGQRVDLVLAAAGSVRVRVVDVDGATVPNASVAVSAAGWNGGYSATTDADGTALLDGVVLGGVSLRADADGYGSRREVDVLVARGGVTETTLVLDRGFAIRGRVSDPSGAPVFGAGVELRPESASWWISPRTGRTDRQGVFEIVLPAEWGETVEVRAAKDGVGYARTYVDIASTKRNARGRAPGAGPRPRSANASSTNAYLDVLLAIGETTAIRGGVVDADGRPVANAIVGISELAASRRAPPVVVVRSDPLGGFELAVPTASANAGQMLLFGYDAERGSGTFIVAAAPAPNPTIRLRGNGTVDGIARAPDGLPAEGAVVTLARASLSELLPFMVPASILGLTASTDAEGRVRIAGVPAGTYRIEVSWGDAVPSSVEPIVVRAGHVSTFGTTFSKPPVVEGHVRGVDGRPIPGAIVVTATPANPFHRRWAARTDLNGRFVVRVEPAEPHASVLSVAAPGYLDREIGIEPGVTDLDVRLTPFGWIDGVVLHHAQGSPETLVQVVAWKADVPRGDRPDSEISVHIDAEFRMPSLAPGEYELTARSSDGGVTSAKTTVAVVDGAGSGPVELRLVRGASIAGRIVDADGAPVRSLTVHVSEIPPDGSPGAPSFLATTGADGRFEILGLPSGDVRIVAVDDAGRRAVEDFELELGAVHESVLRLRGPGSILVRVVDGAGRPVAGANVLVGNDTQLEIPPSWALLRKEGKWSGEDRDRTAHLMTDGNGRLTRFHVPAGRVSVVVRDVRGELLTHDPVSIEVEGDRTSEVTITVTRVERVGRSPPR